MMRLICFVACCLSMCISAAASAAASVAASAVADAPGDFQLAYLAPQDQAEREVQSRLQQSRLLEDTLANLNQHFVLNETLIIEIGSADGPLFDPESLRIQVPYGFVLEVQRRFEEGENSGGLSPEDAALDALLHSLLHEVAHALVALHELPVVGREEDAADSLAVILLIELFEEGREISITAAELFDLESQDRELSEEDFWDEHSLDAQRYYSTLCLVYGSSPTDYQELPEQLGFSSERAENCESDYQIASENWWTLLAPHSAEPQ